MIEKDEITMRIFQMKNDSYSYGAHDCCTFVDRALGLGLRECFSEYDDARSSLVAMARMGIDHPYEIANRVARPVTEFPCRGDIAGYDGAVGVVIGTHAAFASDRGYVMRPVDECRAFWRADESMIEAFRTLAARARAGGDDE